MEPRQIDRTYPSPVRYLIDRFDGKHRRRAASVKSSTQPPSPASGSPYKPHHAQNLPRTRRFSSPGAVDEGTKRTRSTVFERYSPTSTATPGRRSIGFGKAGRSMCKLFKIVKSTLPASDCFPQSAWPVGTSASQICSSEPSLQDKPDHIRPEGEVSTGSKGGCSFVSSG